jgi:deoxycytidylate deaminase
MQKRVRERIIAVGMRLAFKSNMKMRHGAVITSATGKIMATGYNWRLCNLHHAYSIHAEQSAVNNMYRTCKNLPRNTMLHLFVIRVLENGALANSAPCARCRMCINNVRSIRKVFYSNSPV